MEMPGSEKIIDSQEHLLARELLAFYDELTALNACSAFVMQALASALMSEEGLDERATTGAMLCAQWLNNRSMAVEQRLKTIQARVHASTGSDAS
jgi:hypothetical protein